MLKEAVLGLCDPHLASKQNVLWAVAAVFEALESEQGRCLKTRSN